MPTSIASTASLSPPSPWGGKENDGLEFSFIMSVIYLRVTHTPSPTDINDISVRKNITKVLSCTSLSFIDGLLGLWPTFLDSITVFYIFALAVFTFLDVLNALSPLCL